jgi:RNA polymerase sigma-70 factor, ECF subfamily
MDFLTDLESCIPSLRRYARALLHHPEDADDLVQDCLERAIGRRHLWYGGASVRPWLFRIMRNLSCNRARSRRARPVTESIDALRDEPAVDGAQTASLTLREMEAALGRLREDQREVVVMVALTGMSYQDCATALDLPLGTVMSRLARGRECLRQMLEGNGAAGGEPLLRRVK